MGELHAERNARHPKKAQESSVCECCTFSRWSAIVSVKRMKFVVSDVRSRGIFFELISSYKFLVRYGN